MSECYYSITNNHMNASSWMLSFSKTLSHGELPIRPCASQQQAQNDPDYEIQKERNPPSFPPLGLAL